MVIRNKMKKSFADLMEESSNEILESKFYSISILANVGRDCTKVENVIRCLRLLKNSSNKVRDMVSELIKQHFRKLGNPYNPSSIEIDKGKVIGKLNTPQYAANCHPVGIGEPVYEKEGSYMIYHSHYHAGRDYPIAITKKNWEFIDFFTKKRG